MSTFNSRTLEIMSSDASKVYAFVERLVGKDVTFDINKCRTNQLYYSKYAFPVFLVIVEPKPHKQGSKTAGDVLRRDQPVLPHLVQWVVQSAHDRLLLRAGDDPRE